jgi:phage shock protein A
MNSKITTYVLGALLVGALVFAFYQRNEAIEHESKYEEALIDAEKSAQRIEEMRAKLESAEKDCEAKLEQAKQELAQLQAKKK